VKIPYTAYTHRFLILFHLLSEPLTHYTLIPHSKVSSSTNNLLSNLVSQSAIICTFTCVILFQASFSSFPLCPISFSTPPVPTPTQSRKSTHLSPNRMSRTQALHENVHRQSRTVEWPVHEGRKNNLYPSEVFGQMVFDLKELSMQLPKPSTFALTRLLPDR